jgi:hypothetical protein
VGAQRLSDLAQGDFAPEHVFVRLGHQRGLELPKIVEFYGFYSKQSEKRANMIRSSTMKKPAISLKYWTKGPMPLPTCGKKLIYN